MIEQIRVAMAEAGLAPELMPLIIGLSVLQLALQVAALIDLMRRPHVTLGDRKWAWLIIILLGQTIGSVLYFALGRVKYTPGEHGKPLVDRAAAEEKAQRIVDKLYGEKSDKGARQ